MFYYKVILILYNLIIATGLPRDSAGSRSRRIVIGEI